MSSSEKRPDQFLVADGGLRIPQIPKDDPLLSLDDLMAVVEALCPRWPERDTFVTGSKMLL